MFDYLEKLLNFLSTSCSLVLCCSVFSISYRLSNYDFLQMNVPLYGLLGVATAVFVYVVGIGMIAKLFVCLLALLLGYDPNSHLMFQYQDILR